MSKKNITYFGKVNNKEEDYFEGHVTLGNKDVELDLDFCSYEGDPKDWSAELENYLSNLLKYKTEIDKAILEDYEKGGQRMNMFVGILMNGMLLMIYYQMSIRQKQEKNSFYPC